MTGLAERLADWRSPLELAFALTPVQAQRALQRIERELGAVAPKEPSRFDLEESYQKLRDAAREPGSLERLDRRTLKYAPWVIFESWEGKRPLAEETGFLNAYLRRLAALPANAAILNLALAFLRYYPRQLPLFDLLRKAVYQLLGRCGSQRCRRLVTCCKHFGLLDADGPVRFWQWLAEQHEPIDVSLGEACLAGPLLQSGFIEAPFEQAVLEIRSALGNGRLGETRLQRLLAFALTEKDEGQALRFPKPSHRIGLAQGLLLPFRENTSAGGHRETIQEFLIRQYRDPRMDRSRWQGISDEAVSVLLGWLVEDTLEDFFRLLEYTARGDSTASRHWRYRKAFWTAYLKSGVISDAWVVLAPMVDMEARPMLGSRGEGYGRLERGGGVLRNHAVLIMRIDRLVITEWSHSGSYRVWDEAVRESGDVPRPYKRRYSRYELIRSPDLEKAHHGSEGGGWQQRLSSYIREKTGIRMYHRDLMPR